jgi:serine protease AprX
MRALQSNSLKRRSLRTLRTKAQLLRSAAADVTSPFDRRALGCHARVVHRRWCARLRPVLGESGGGTGHRGKLDRYLQEVKGRPSESVRVIVRTAKGKQAPVGDRARAARAQDGGDLASLNAFVADVTGADVAELERDPDVLGVSTDALVSSFGANLDVSRPARCWTKCWVSSRRAGPATRSASPSWTRASSARRISTAGARTSSSTFHGDGNEKAFDDYGHGTHVAGLIGGTGKQSMVKRAMRERNGSMKVRDVAFFAGVAPQARLLSFKVLDEHGAGYTSQVIAASTTSSRTGPS